MNDSNINDLMKAGQQVLEQQKKENEKEKSRTQAIPDDIYAEFRDDEEVEEQQSGNIEYQEPDILYKDLSDLVEGESISHDSEQPEFSISNKPEAIFEGGPTVAQIDEWKKQFDNEKIFHTKVLNRHFVFRTLNRYEYKQIVAIQDVDALYREETICRTCVLWPYNYNFKTMAVEDSGYPSTLAAIIMENSGFTDSYDIEVL